MYQLLLLLLLLLLLFYCYCCYCYCCYFNLIASSRLYWISALLSSPLLSSPRRGSPLLSSDIDNNSPLLNSFPVYRRVARQARLSQQALNRWFLALMLMRNPSLLTYRRQRSGAQPLSLQLHGAVNSDKEDILVA